MNLSGHKGSSEQGVTPISSAHPTPFTTILNIPYATLPSYLPPSSSLLTPPGISPGSKFHGSPQLHDPRKGQTANQFGCPKSTPTPVASFSTNASAIDDALAHNRDPASLAIHGQKSSNSSGYLDFLKSLINEEKLKRSSLCNDTQAACIAPAPPPVPPLATPPASVPRLWSPAANLHNESSMLSQYARAGVPLVSPHQYDQNQLLLASAPGHPPRGSSTATTDSLPYKETGPTTRCQSHEAAVTQVPPQNGPCKCDSMPQGSSTSVPSGPSVGPSNDCVSLPPSKSSPSVEEEKKGPHGLLSEAVPFSGALPLIKPDLNVVVPKEVPAPLRTQPDPLFEEEGIDVCDFKEPSLLLKKATHVDRKLHDGERVSITDDESEQDASPPLPNFSHLGSECARTVPSLMKFYSRHKRSLSSSLSVSLSVSGQATPPSSPISPGTIPRPHLPSRDGEKVSTSRSEDSRHDSVHNHSLQESKNLHSSFSVPTLLTIPRVTPPSVAVNLSHNSGNPEKITNTLSAPFGSQEQSTTCDSHYDQSKNIRGISQNGSQMLHRYSQPQEETRSENPVVLPPPPLPPPSVSTPASTSLQVSTSVPSLGPPASSNAGVLQAPMTLNPYATPWPIPHNPCPTAGIPSAPFWIPQGVDASVAARIGLGYHLASDPLTGHLLLVPRPHPLSDPSSPGLVWAGFGAPQVVMTPQQLLLGDPHYRHPLHTTHSLLHLSPHSQLPPPPMHSPTKKDSPSHSPILKDNQKKNTQAALRVPGSPPSNFPLPPTIPPSNLQPHYLYPPTSLPYYFPQPPSHPSHFLSSFNNCSTSSSLSHNLLSFSAHTTSSTTTLTTKALTAAVASTTVSRSQFSSNSKSSIWPASSNKATSPMNFCPATQCSSFDNEDMYSEPPIDLTRHPKSPIQASVTNPTPSRQYPPPKMQPLSPLSICTTSNLQTFNISKQTTTTFIIKKEIKEEVLSPNCPLKSDSPIVSEHQPIGLLKPKVKEESDLPSIKSRCSCKAEVKDKALQVSSGVNGHHFEEKLLATVDAPASIEEQTLPPPPPPTENASVATSPLSLPRCSSSVDLDLSGLELLSHSILEHADRIGSPKPVAPQQLDSDIETSSTHSDTMPLLEPAIYSPSPRSSPSSYDNLPPILSPPVPLSSLASKADGDASRSAWSSETPHFTSSCNGLHGLSLLCALAEQRIREEVGQESPRSGGSGSSLAEVASNGTDSSNDENSVDLNMEPGMNDTVGDFPLVSKQPLSGCDIRRQQEYLSDSDGASEPMEIDINSNYTSPTLPPIGVDITPQCLQADSPTSCSPREASQSQFEPNFSIKSEQDTISESMQSNICNYSKEADNAELFTVLDNEQKTPQIDSLKPKIKAEDARLEVGASSTALSRFKLPGSSLDLKQEDSEEELCKEQLSTDVSDRESKGSLAETSVESSPSDAELQPTLISSSKKRKPGRPKKHSPSKDDATETIVAKKPKSMNFMLLSHSHPKSRVKPKLKAELKLREAIEDEECEDEFAIQTNNTSILEQNTKKGRCHFVRKRFIKRRAGRGGFRGRSSLTRKAILRDKEKRKYAFEKQLHLQALFRSLKKHSTMAAAEHDESEDEKEEEGEEEEEDEKNLSLMNYISLKEEDTSKEGHFPEGSESKSGKNPSTTLLLMNRRCDLNGSNASTSDSSSPSMQPSQQEHWSLMNAIHLVKDEAKLETSSPSRSPAKDQQKEEENSICKLQIEDLVSNARVLILQEGLLYPGSLSLLDPPNLYDVHLDGERSTNEHIFCQEDLLTQAWKEVKPGSTRFLTEGTRVCAFWSQQYRGLYSGTVAPASSPSQEGNHNFVNVEFDDGDSGRIHIDDVRLLPQDYPITEHDPNPLLTLNRRKRRTASETLDHHKAATGEPSSKKPKKRFSSPKPKVAEPTEPHRDQEDKENVTASPSSVEDANGTLESKKSQSKKKHKKRKHKHKHKHKEQRPLPHVEQMDGGELRFRIKSPPPLSTEGNKDDPNKSVNSKEDFEQEETVMSSEEDGDEQQEEGGHDEEASSACAGEDTSKKNGSVPGKRRKRKLSEKSKIAPFMLKRRLWKWSGKGYWRPGAKGRSKKQFYKEIIRCKEETIRVGDCAVFISVGSPVDRPYIGRIESLWESWGGTMMVKVKWFYHPDETKGLGKRLAEPKRALFHSPHTDENDVQTISHKCCVVPLSEYKLKRAELELKNGPEYENYDLYYLAGFYDPVNGRITMEPGVS